MNSFHLVIASVGETRFDGPSISATFPGSEGELTVLAHHEPLVTTLKKGKILVKESSGARKVFDIDEGVLEISGNHAVVLL
ncbi:hypothetical protein HY478_00780 [Candidatus Uhrbacteria bacterium]|nr:hypothetical protein [Candidatus Uhrbacteria bacterium]